ncbi:MAG: hypothetical protein QGI09_10560, partial [Dehalococcoidia bacterium]|nr:hypothetical protein [Dehalococcoidia bacterium]
DRDRTCALAESGNLRAVLCGQLHRVPARQSVDQMRVIDAVFESLRTRAAVEMGEYRVQCRIQSPEVFA